MRHGQRGENWKEGDTDLVDLRVDVVGHKDLTRVD